MDKEIPHFDETEMNSSVCREIDESREGFITTGIAKLDDLLEGGIPEGFTTLIEGVPGSSIEILAKQIASAGKSLYFSTGEPENEIIDTMKRFKWNTDDINIVDIASAFAEDVLEDEQERVDAFKHRSRINVKELISKGSSGMPKTDEGTPDFLAMLLTKTAQLSLPPRIIVNSLDFFLNEYPPDEVVKVVHALKMKNMQNKCALFLIVTKDTHDDNTERKLEVIADCIIELDITQKAGSYDRHLTVKKMRDYARKIGVANYTIEDNGFRFETIERII